MLLLFVGFVCWLCVLLLRVLCYCVDVLIVFVIVGGGGCWFVVWFVWLCVFVCLVCIVCALVLLVAFLFVVVRLCLRVVCFVARLAFLCWRDDCYCFGAREVCMVYCWCVSVLLCVMSCVLLCLFFF